ncbi:MAG: putative phosphoglycerate mutase [Alphaproteobacteria bacterium]|jgi:probable phosphoglycerate mutase
MHNFYFIRHAQTEANFAQIMCGGGVDTPLTALGIEQAHKAQEILHTHHEKTPIHVLINSDMQRTRKTSAILNEVLNLPIIKDSSLKEHVVGDWEGKSWITIAKEYTNMSDPPNGEPFADFKHRIYTAMHHHLKTTTIPLFVAHGGVWRAFMTSYNITIDTHPDNAQLYYFEVHDNNTAFPWTIYHCQENGIRIKITL